MPRILIFTCAVLTSIGCTQSDGVVKAQTEPTTVVAFNSDGAPTVEFSVPDMMCPEGCGEATREILANQDGVKDVKIDFPAKLAVVAIDTEKFDADKALAELVDKGFDHSAVKASSDQ